MPRSGSLLYSSEMDEDLLGEVDRFTRRVLEPVVARPEAPMGRATFEGALREADALGLLSSMEPSGLGPWEELDQGESPQRTLRVLRRLSAVNTGFAFAVHQRALARAVGRRTGWEADAIAPEGSTRLGRVSFARWFAGKLDDDDRDVLSDVYGASATRVLPFEGNSLITPVFVGGELWIQWHDSLRVDARPGHGLDELPTAIVTPSSSPRAETGLDLAPIFAAHQLALLAMSLGAVERAHGLARRFSAQRRQGGDTIDRHPAVLALLGKTRAAIDTVDAQLASFGALDLRALFRAVAFRAESPLCDAAHAALQVFGGLGYMRDTGLEKVSRDVNCLRAMAGAPPELALIAAEGERLHG